MFNLLKALSFFFLIPFSLVFSDCPWAELPEGNYQEIISDTSWRCKQLNLLIDSYHTEPKDSPVGATIRIAKLTDIATFLQNWITEEPEKTQLKKILELVENKNSYLSAIMHIYLCGKSQATYLKDYHVPTKEQELLNPLSLVNELEYSLTEKEYVGGYWIENIDPCHRVLGDYYKKWHRLRESNEACPWFFLWLETQNVPVNTPVVRYLPSWELSDAKFLVLDGLLIDRVNGQPCQGKYLLAIDLQKKLYLKKQEAGLYFTSFSRGKPLLGAVYLICENGIVTKIAFDSQRYAPQNEHHYEQLVSLLIQNRFPLASEVRFQYYQEKKKFEIAIHSAIMENGPEFINVLFNRNDRVLIIDP